MWPIEWQKWSFKTSLKYCNCEKCVWSLNNMNVHLCSLFDPSSTFDIQKRAQWDFLPRSVKDFFGWKKELGIMLKSYSAHNIRWREREATWNSSGNVLPFKSIKNRFVFWQFSKFNVGVSSFKTVSPSFKHQKRNRSTKTWLSFNQKVSE